MSIVRDVARALTLAKVRFVIIGGVAVVLHGHLRATKDLDLVIDLSPDEARRAMDVLTVCGLQPNIPIKAHDFADPDKRRDWIEHKNMMVLQMIDPSDPRRNVDVAVEYPIEFEHLWSRAKLLRLDDVMVRVASIPDLIVMKTRAGRPQDLSDIEALKRVESIDDEKK
jgi:hypothetical protein